MLARVEKNALARGFYTIPEAARLIEVGNARRIRNWLTGYPKSHIGPLLHRDFSPVGNKQELSFLDLMEVRFVEFFREQGVSVRTLRKALITAREVLNHEKPFAMSYIKFHAVDNKQEILIEQILRPAAEEAGDRRMMSLTSRQYVFVEVLLQNIALGVTFDPETHLAERWAPRSQQFPNVFVDPTVSYGQPAVPSGVPTSTLFHAWKAEDRDLDRVASWFDVPIEHVREAVGFEQLLDQSQSGETTVH